MVQVKDRKITLRYTADGSYPEEEQSNINAVLKQMTQYSKSTWDRLNMEQKNLDGLEDAFISGDYILYHWWNTQIETGQPFPGDIDSVLVDNVNYYPGNPNSSDVQSQPYIIIAFRIWLKTSSVKRKKTVLRILTR